MDMRRLALVIHNVRSALNVGSMLRTAEGLGVNEVYMTGYTPYPHSQDDARLPHLQQKTSRQIHKTALGAEDSVMWHHQADIMLCMRQLADTGYVLAALEQTPRSMLLTEFKSDRDIALIVGNEVSGLEQNVQSQADKLLQIPMSGRKESFNVAVAAGIALYHLRYFKR
jgi:23S rRNA (guanosine2251-2'-O)-methyltransferase